MGSPISPHVRLLLAAGKAAELLIPPRFEAFAFSGSAVYEVWRDADDVEHVRVLGYH